jgi:putative phosphoesterase
MEIAIISDTHMPRGPRRLPDRCVQRLRAAQLIIHAGDLTTLEVLHELQSVNTTVAVHGNVDDAAVRAALPETALVRTEAHVIAVVHDAGPARGRSDRLRRRFPTADAVVFGHSHIPLHERAPDGFQIFNPGSPTERRRAPRHTMGIARVNDGRLDFELIGLD